MLVISGLGVGGAERVVVDLADAFSARGHEVCLVSLSGISRVLPSDQAVQLVELNVTKTPIGLLCGALALMRAVRQFRPEVVHSHLVHANIAMRVLRILLRFPRLVTTAHNANEEGRFRMLAYRLTDRFADISTNVSDEAVAAFEAAGAVPRGGMITVHNGIRTDACSFSDSARVSIRAQLGISEKCQLIVAVGRLEPPKDYPNLLQALALLDRNSDWQVAVAGDGSLHDELNALGADLGILDRVRFLGIRRDVPALLSAADTFVLASAWEGFPMVVGEAMACARVIVATDCGGVTEFLGETGFLVPPKDHVALAEALRRAIELPLEEKTRLGNAARRRVVDLYGLDAAVDKWIKLYSRSLA